MTIDKAYYEQIMKRCQIGLTGRRPVVLDEANNLLAECYGGIGALLAEIDQLKVALDMESAELAWSDSDGREQGAENAKLRAELAGLRTGYDAQSQVIAGLHKDAERWRWFARKYEGRLEQEVDAAMAKEGRHDN